MRALVFLSTAIKSGPVAFPSPQLSPPAAPLKTPRLESVKEVLLCVRSSWLHRLPQRALSNAPPIMSPDRQVD